MSEGNKGNKALPGNLLKATSRSFYLTLRVLPARVRPQIGLAYLLARTTDTIADTEIIPPAQRRDALIDDLLHVKANLLRLEPSEKSLSRS